MASNGFVSNNASLKCLAVYSRLFTCALNSQTLTDSFPLPDSPFLGCSLEKSTSSVWSLSVRQDSVKAHQKQIPSLYGQLLVSTNIHVCLHTEMQSLKHGSTSRAIITQNGNVEQVSEASGNWVSCNLQLLPWIALTKEGQFITIWLSSVLHPQDLALVQVTTVSAQLCWYLKPARWIPLEQLPNPAKHMSQHLTLHLLHFINPLLPVFWQTNHKATCKKHPETHLWLLLWLPNKNLVIFRYLYTAKVVLGGLNTNRITSGMSRDVLSPVHPKPTPLLPIPRSQTCTE